MMIPTIHLNGTSKDSLVEGYAEAYRAVGKALSALQQSWPHGRDYYPQGANAIYEALKEHHARCEKLRDVMKEIQDIVEAIDT